MGHQKLAKQQNVVPYQSPETGRASQSIPTTKPIPASKTLVNSNKTVQSMPSTIPYSKEENRTNSNEPIGSVEEKGSVKCGNVTCAPNAHCVENECTCNPGFTGNGKKCVSDHAYDTVNDDGERQVAREPTTLEKGFGRVVEMEKKKAKDAIETEIKKGGNFH